MKSEIYWNLRKKAFSVRQRGKVVSHGQRLFIKDALFVVQRGGWMRSIESGQRNVHAFVRGEIGFPSQTFDKVLGSYSDAMPVCYRRKFGLFLSDIDRLASLVCRRASLVEAVAIDGRPELIAWGLK